MMPIIKPSRNFLSHYFHPRVLSMLFFGISAGVPYLLITTTFYMWLLEEGTSQTVITSFAICTLPSSFKFLWAHWVDQLKLPILHRLGQYRSWFIFSQFGVLASLIFLSQVVVGGQLYVMAIAAVLVSFFAAIQDIAFGAYRVMILTKDQQPFGSSLMVIGYRVGSWLSAGGVLLLLSMWTWPAVYVALALVQLQGMLTAFCNPEPEAPRLQQKRIRYYQFNRVIRVLYQEFFTQPKWRYFLLYIFLFKFGDAALNAFMWIFIKKIGFSKEEITLAVNLGFGTNVFGAILAGIVIHRLKIKISLYGTAFLQMLIFLTLVIQAVYPKDETLMYTTLLLANFVCGFAAACIYTKFAYNVTKRFSAIQYTFFASFASLSKTVIVSVGGWLLMGLSWPTFFALMFAAPLVSIMVIHHLYKHQKEAE